MEKRIEKVNEEILKLRGAGMSCSQSTLIGLARAFSEGMPDEATLSALSVTLRGGIGATFDEGTCGALTGAAIALGLIYRDDPKMAVAKTKELYNTFKERFGSVRCGVLLKEKRKESCTQSCLFAGECAAKLAEGGIM